MMEFEDEADFAQNERAQNIEQLAKKLVRLALACEYARQPIRRADVSAKVLGPQSRQFKAVFDEAQLTLKSVFGMEMVELPPNENVTLAQKKKAAQRSQSQSASSTAKSWRLATTLPEKYRDTRVIQLPRAPATSTESAYVGLYTFVVATIALNDGVLPNLKLERYLRRTNADSYTPVDKTDKLLQRMQREGYVVRVVHKDPATGDETVEWMVGPRGKTEVDSESIVSLVKLMYGEDAPDDLDRRLERSLGLGRRAQQQHAAGSEGRAAGGPKRKRGRTAAEGADQDEDEEMEDSADEEDYY